MRKQIWWSTSLLFLGFLVSCERKFPATFHLTGTGNPVDKFIISSTGKYLLSHEKSSKTADFWDVAQQKVIHHFSMANEIQTSLISPEETQVLTCTQNQCTLWNQDTEQSVWTQNITLIQNPYTNSVSFVAKQNLIWVVNELNTKSLVSFLDRATGNPTAVFPTGFSHSEYWNGVTISPTENLYLYQKPDGRAVVNSFSETVKFQPTTLDWRIAVFSTDETKVIALEEPEPSHYLFRSFDLASGYTQVLAEHTFPTSLADEIFIASSGKYLEILDNDPDRMYYHHFWEFDLTSFSLTQRAESFDVKRCISSTANFIGSFDRVRDIFSDAPVSHFTVSIRGQSAVALDGASLGSGCKFSSDEQYVVATTSYENGDLGVWDLSGLYL